MIQVGTEDVIFDKVKWNLSSNKNNKASIDEINQLHILASALMWMKAFKSEEAVLQFLLKNNYATTAVEQERLYLLSTSSAVDINITDQFISNEMLNIRMDTVDWKSEDYTNFFNNLSFQNKKLSELLVLRDDKKDIVLSSNLKLPPLNEITNKLQTSFDDEYGEVVQVRLEKINSITLDCNEEMEGFFISNEEVSSLGLFALLIRIGKKINIKFYTLYVPEDVAVEQQAKRAISMFKKISPTITMWENSLKDTFLFAIQYIINNSSNSSSNVDLNEIQEF